MLKKLSIGLFMCLLQACAAPAPPTCSGDAKRVINGRLADADPYKVVEVDYAKCSRTRAT